MLDPWAGHALYEAAHLAKQIPGSQLWLVSLGPKAKLQQLMMTIAQKAPFQLVVLDGAASGFTDAHDVATSSRPAQSTASPASTSPACSSSAAVPPPRATAASPCNSSARRSPGIRDQFAGVDELKVEVDGLLRILERIEGGQYQVSRCKGPPAVLAWATGSLSEPPNNPQIGMMNMRTIMPNCRKPNR